MRPPVTLLTCIPCDMITFLALRCTRSRSRAPHMLRQRPTPSGRGGVSRATGNAAEAADGGRAMHEATERAADGVLVATAMAVATMVGAVVARRRQSVRRRLEAAAGRGKTAAAATAMAGTVRGAVRGLGCLAGEGRHLLPKRQHACRRGWAEAGYSNLT